MFSTLAGALGVDTIETVLLHHVAAGATLTDRQTFRGNVQIAHGINRDLRPVDL